MCRISLTWHWQSCVSARTSCLNLQEENVCHYLGMFYELLKQCSAVPVSAVLACSVASAVLVLLCSCWNCQASNTLQLYLLLGLKLRGFTSADRILVINMQADTQLLFVLLFSIQADCQCWVWKQAPWCERSLLIVNSSDMHIDFLRLLHSLGSVQCIAFLVIFRMFKNEFCYSIWKNIAISLKILGMLLFFSGDF